MAHTPVLLVMDMQNFLLTHAHDRDAVVATVVSLRSRAIAASVPVVTVMHRADWLRPDTEGWRMPASLQPAEGEPVVHKATVDGFFETDLDERLRALGATEVVIAGLQSEFCVDSTARRSLSLGYDLVLVADGHSTPDREETPEYISAAQARRHVNTTFGRISFPGRKVRVLAAGDVDFGEG